jgi:hypothetical protein
MKAIPDQPERLREKQRAGQISTAMDVESIFNDERKLRRFAREFRQFCNVARRWHRSCDAAVTPALVTRVKPQPPIGSA